MGTSQQGTRNDGNVDTYLSRVVGGGRAVAVAAQGVADLLGDRLLALKTSERVSTEDYHSTRRKDVHVGLYGTSGVVGAALELVGEALGVSLH